MWATLALAAVLQPVPAQGGKPSIENVRTTYGILGSERKDTKFLPGDSFFISFDIKGLQMNKDDGKVEYDMSIEVKDKKGNTQFKQEGNDLHANIVLGGAALPAIAKADIGLDTPPGEYTLTVTVVDRGTKEKVKIDKPFEVLPKNFGIVGLCFTDAPPHPKIPRNPMPPIAVPGQTLMVNFMVVGFELKDKQPNLTFEMRIMDEKGKPTMNKPFTGDVTMVDDESRKNLSMQFPIPINRNPGKYTVELMVRDKIKDKKVEEKMTFTVIDPK
jgi:hypothetical protein